MNRRLNSISMVIVGALAGMLSTSAFGQTEAEIKEQMKADKTGSNPLNFTYDARIYDEYRWLNTDGDGHQNLATLEIRAPFANGSWQFRGKIRRVDLKADFNDDGLDDVNESGFGDTDLRFMTLPVMSTWALATGVEFFLDTASEDALGTGANSVAPFVFFGIFNPFGPKTLFVPGYQHTMSVNEDDGRDDVRWGLIDAFMLKQSGGGRTWGYIDPQVILDYENHTEYMLLEIQAGTMIGSGGQSLYVLPSFGIGTDRPYDVSVEAAWKVVW
jgi:hypothetical protein